MYRCVRDVLQLCLVRVNSLITHLQLKKISVIYQSAHVAITFQLLETGFPLALENLENHKKSSMHGKIMEFEKN